MTPSLEPDEVVHFESVRSFREWLEEHHERRDALWVGYWKKATGRPSLTWEESVELDVRYVDNWSLGRDLLILWKTARAVLRGSGAY